MAEENNEMPITILIAEDDDGHARLIQEHLKDAGVHNPIHRLRDGEETLAFLEKSGKDKDHKYLLLLDIKMPGIDGIQVLKKLKADERLKTLPVIMVTTTDDPRDIEACYRAGCSNYLVKPVGFTAFAEMITRLGLFILIIKVPKV
ncbi:MAG TPA: response regulator [Elusimicrobiales bacterium]|nr:response regulator [Elusimicrobiales bacterium]